MKIQKQIQTKAKVKTVIVCNHSRQAEDTFLSKKYILKDIQCNANFKSYLM